MKAEVAVLPAASDFPETQSKAECRFPNRLMILEI
jgi:hypothetical protein